MPALSDIRAEINAAANEGEENPFAFIRRRYMLRLSELTGNNVAVYATGFLQNQQSSNLDIESEDVRGFMDILYDLDKNKGLDLIIHSPGGVVEAAEGISDYLHQHFGDRTIRVVVPYMAMSAAAMLACAGDLVVMGEHSSLGPIDPQFYVRDGEGWRQAPAYTILQEFRYLRRIRSAVGAGWTHAASAQNSSRMGFNFLREIWSRRGAGWAHMVAGRYPLGMLSECRNMTKMCERLAKNWLQRRMFRHDSDKMKKAEKLAKYLANHGHFRSHGRRISLAKMQEMEMRVQRLEDDEKIQDATLSIFHALCLTFSDTPISKIIENHNGRAFVQRG